MSQVFCYRWDKDDSLRTCKPFGEKWYSAQTQACDNATREIELTEAQRERLADFYYGGRQGDEGEVDEVLRRYGFIVWEDLDEQCGLQILGVKSNFVRKWIGLI